MSAKVLSGKELAAEIRAEIREGVSEFQSRTGVQPCLATVLVGRNPASLSYVSAKQRTCEELGMKALDFRLDADSTQEDLEALIERLDADHSVHGILVQLPLPDHLDSGRILERIDPAKDVDGFHPVNLGRLLAGRPGLVPCTPAGILEMLQRAHVPLQGAHVVIVGRSTIVGRPLAALLVQKGVDATVTVCHSRTKDLGEVTRQADVLVVAAGRPGLIGADMVREGVVVIDVGVNRVGTTKSGKAKLKGDVDFEALSEKASLITPVPGGVGPMTITMLMANTLQAATGIHAATGPA